MPYEIQVKTILDKKTYLQLLDMLPSKLGQPTRGMIHQTRYRSGPWQPGDVRLRRLFAEIDTDQSIGQVIIKEDKPGESVAASERKERHAIVRLDELAEIRTDLDQQGIYRDPTWKKVKHDFTAQADGSTYRISIQYCSGVIVEQGYVAEGTIKLDAPDTGGAHKKNLISIFSSIGLSETPAKEFLAMVVGFVTDNSRYATGTARPYEDFEKHVKATFSKYSELRNLV